MKILYNARIYTFDPNLPRASVLVIDQGQVVGASREDAFRAEFGGNADQEDLQGRVVIPGLTDAHIHLQSYALSLQKVGCETHTRAECLDRVAERACLTPPGAWVLGHGWNQNTWPEGFGTSVDLDKVAPNNPVYLTAKSLHAAWVNSTALRSAGVSEETPDPPGGRLGRDHQGKLTGILFESAMELVGETIPEASQEAIVQAIAQAQPILWRMGLTGAHDFDRRQCFSALQVLHGRGELRTRVIKSIPLEDLPHAIALGLRSGFGDDTLRTGSVKAFADGALGPHTAAMLQPYEDDDENRGMLFLDAEELFEHGKQAVANGLSLAVHAIGDRAVHEVLQSFKQLQEYERSLPFFHSNRLRHRIEHVQITHPDDASRLGEMGIIASMQPIHATSDMQMADRYWGKRSTLAYAWRTQLDHGTTLAFGSDAPVESPNPFWGVHAAVTRRRQDGLPGPEGWYPGQRLSVLEALRAYTIGAAYAVGMEGRLGRLSAGFLADLLVLDQDPFTCPPDEIAGIHPLATMIGGEWVWRG